MSSLRQRVPVLAAIVWLAVVPFASGQHRENRTWTSSDGRTLEGSLLHANAESVRLRLSNGQEYDVPLSRLSERDRDYVEDMAATGRTVKVKPMPKETKIDTQITVEGGPRNFHTPHFEFGTDQGVSKSFIGEASRVFEGTLHAVASLPLGIDPKPAEGATRFRTLFLGRNAFDVQISGLVKPSTPNPFGGTTTVAGIYIPKRKEVLVPFSSLETGRSGSQITLRRTSDTSTLIHEIVHQVMHDWLVMTPVWFSEGLAEYVAAVPYQNGRFEFQNIERGIAETLEEQYYISKGTPIQMIHPADLIEMKSSHWRGTSDDYLSSMLLVYYFMNLDQPDKPGAALAGYLHLLQKGMSDTENSIAEHNSLVNDFEKKRLAFNEEVKKFNDSLLRYRKEVDEYNYRVKFYNEQLRNNVAKEDLIEVGDEPVEPGDPPERPEVPAELKSNGGTFDMSVAIHNVARPALIRDRNLDELGKSVAAALSEAGVPVTMKERGAVYEPVLNPRVPDQPMRTSPFDNIRPPSF